MSTGAAPGESSVAPVRAAAGARLHVWPAVAIGGALSIAVGLAALRVEPQVWGDPGIWLSVGARLLEGDRLYADVFDNKDPLFFYGYAASLWVGGVRGPFVLEVVWLALSAVGMALALRAIRAGAPAVVAGAAVYPLALTASWYVPGATMVPALALAPFALWLWARGSPFWAGVVVVATLLLKLNLGLVVAAPLLALLALGEIGVSRRRRAIAAVAGAGAALSVAALVLAVRGELRPYLDTIVYNVHYSDAGVHEGGIRAHLEIVRVFFAASGKWQLPAAELAAALLVVLATVGWLRLGSTFRRLSAVAVVTLAAALVTLALTAVFTVHLQLLAYPAALGAATLVLALKEVGRPAAIVAAAACVLLAGWSSLKHEDLSELTLRTWTREPVSTPGHALESTRARFFQNTARVTYAVFGRNTEDGHAAFVADTMDLRCRYFHQYPFYRDEQLAETLDCARREKPMLILLTTSFYDPMREPAWTAFVADTRALLGSQYELVTEEGMSQVWRRR